MERRSFLKKHVFPLPERKSMKQIIGEQE